MCVEHVKANCPIW